MKKLFSILLVLISLQSFGQLRITPFPQYPGNLATDSVYIPLERGYLNYKTTIATLLAQAGLSSIEIAAGSGINIATTSPNGVPRYTFSQDINTIIAAIKPLMYQDGTPHLIYSNNTSLVDTNSTANVAVITFTIPANSIGPNGSIEFEGYTSRLGNTNNTVYQIKIGGVTITQWTSAISTVNTIQFLTNLYARGATNVNGYPLSASSNNHTGGWQSGTAVFTPNYSNSTNIWGTNTTIDFTVDQTCTVMIQNTATTDRSAIETFRCITYYK